MNWKGWMSPCSAAVPGSEEQGMEKRPWRVAQVNLLISPLSQELQTPRASSSYRTCGTFSLGTSPWASPESASSTCLVWFEIFCLLWLCCPRTRPPGSHQRDVCSSALESFVTYFWVFNLQHQEEAGKGGSGSSCEFSPLENSRKSHFVSISPFTGLELEEFRSGSQLCPPFPAWFSKASHSPSCSALEVEIILPCFHRSWRYFLQCYENKK